MDASLAGARLAIAPHSDGLRSLSSWAAFRYRAASGAGAISSPGAGNSGYRRHARGLAAACIFFIPVSFDVVERFGIWVGGKGKTTPVLPVPSPRRRELPMTNLKISAVVLLMLSLLSAVRLTTTTSGHP